MASMAEAAAKERAAREEEDRLRSSRIQSWKNQIPAMEEKIRREKAGDNRAWLIRCHEETKDLLYRLIEEEASAA